MNPEQGKYMCIKCRNPDAMTFDEVYREYRQYNTFNFVCKECLSKNE